MERNWKRALSVIRYASLSKMRTYQFLIWYGRKGCGFKSLTRTLIALAKGNVSAGWYEYWCEPCGCDSLQAVFYDATGSFPSQTPPKPQASSLKPSLVPGVTTDG